jgi:hypothetical protein
MGIATSTSVTCTNFDSFARARSLGFTVEQCRALLDLFRDRSRASANAKMIARGRVAEVDRKIEELMGMKATLEHLIERCHGDHRPECPILEDLAGTSSGSNGR